MDRVEEIYSDKLQATGKSYAAPRRSIPTAFIGPDRIPTSIASLMHDETITREVRQRITRDHLAEREPHAICACCEGAVFIAKCNKGGHSLPFYKHYSSSGQDCPWVTNRNDDPRAIRAKQYEGRQTSPRHIALVAALVKGLKADPTVTYVQAEKYCKPQVTSGHGRFPDVYAERSNGERYAFEVQLSTTQMTEIAERRAFYLAEGIRLVWVLDTYEPKLHRESFRDVIHDHSGSMFFYDEDSPALAEENQRFLLKYRLFDQGHMSEMRLVSFEDMKFTGRCLPFVDDALTPHLKRSAQTKRRPLFDWFSAVGPVRLHSWRELEGFPIPDDLLEDWNRCDYVTKSDLASLSALVATCIRARHTGDFSGTGFQNYDSKEPNLSATINSWCVARSRAPFIPVIRDTIDMLNLWKDLKDSTKKLIEKANEDVEEGSAKIARMIVAHFFSDYHDNTVRDAIAERHLGID